MDYRCWEVTHSRLHNQHKHLKYFYTQPYESQNKSRKWVAQLVSQSTGYRFTVFIHISTYPLSELLIDQSVNTTNVARNTIAIFREKREFRDPKTSPTLMMHKRGSNPQPCDLWPRKLPLHHWPLDQNAQTFSVLASSLHFHSCAISSLILSELYSHYRLLSS